MSNSNDNESYYAILGLSPDATLDQVKLRYRKLNEAYLKILELSRKAKSPKATRPDSLDGNNVQSASQPNTNPKQRSTNSQETRTEPIATIKERFASGKINKNQFEKLAMERYDYLKNKSFSDLSDSELDERLKGFEGLKIDPKYWKSKTS